MTIEVRPARPEEYDETGRVTALAYREFADGESWGRYLELIAEVGARADIAVVLAAVEDGRILGSATLELDRRIEDDDPKLPPDEAENAYRASPYGTSPTCASHGAGSSRR